ncbi:MAG: ABC-F family ATP-binding cassette domain-containing protein [Ignavibacteria bacterium]|nr:ABC-F family ATP-binding cassette domain-containing protein [Ignavibacteria bacterium]
MLSVSDITVQFGSKKLFENLSFIVNPKDRIGLVGSNGAGKSTLLKVINGQIESDKGEIAVSKHTTIGYLPQDGITFGGKTIYEEVYSGVGDISALKEEIDQVQKELETHPDHTSEEYMDLVETYGELQHKFELLDGFKIKSNIEKILEGLGFHTKDFDRLTDEFSGGWQMRIALAKLLLKQPSVLLLDEPTNHLDIESLIWVEDFLKTYEGAIILVSHDRKFLDTITNKTIEIYAGKVTIYKGNYTYYVTERDTRKELLFKSYENQQKYLKQQERFITRFRSKASKATSVQSRIKMLDKIERIEIEEEETAIHFNFPPATHSGRKVFELKNVTKSYGDNLVLKDLNLELERGEKIGLVGVNGAGKSTLARIIRGTEEYQSGTRKLGFQVELEYYSQHQADTLDPATNVLGTLDSVATGDIRKQLRTILGSFLFRGDDVFKQVGVLSGGEKSRLALARMLLKSSNFLILDEPTNHLDMNSKRVLMDALHNYTGTILIISHDREFLDGIVTKIIEVKDKNVKTYLGNCSYYIQKKEEEKAGLTEANQPKKTTTLAETNGTPKQKKTKEQKRLEAEQRNKVYKYAKPLRESIHKLEKEIKLLEDKTAEIEKEMGNPDFFKDQQNSSKKTGEYKSAKDKLNDLYHKWSEESKKLAKIEEEIGVS